MVNCCVKILKPTLLLLFFIGRSTLFAQPVASFYASPLSGCNPLKVDFFNTSKTAVSYLWKFGNGNESTLKNPSAVYNNAGSYTITLIATDSLGKSDTTFITDYVRVFQSPQALFSKTGHTLCAGDSLRFIDNSVPGDGPIISWKWDFGDGGTSYDKSPAYRYTLAGVFDVTLALEDSNGCQSSSKSVKFVDVKKLPEIGFTSNLKSKCKAPLDVLFSANISGAAPYQYRWDFGDGNVSGQMTPRNVYNATGNYNVKLSITDANGCSDSLTKPNMVHIAPPTADFVVDLPVICPGNAVTFTNRSAPLDGTGTFAWDFGNGNTSNAENPRVQYNQSGIYTVTLTYRWDGCNATEKKAAYIRVNEAAEGSISPSDAIVCRSAGDSLLLRSKGKNLASVNWYVNGAFMGNSPHFIGYKLPISINGTYSVVAVFLSPDGCLGTPDTSVITVKGPIAAITADPVDGCIPFNGTAKWSGSGTSPIVGYQWLGIGSSGSGTTYNFTKTTFGKTPLRLVVTDTDGCMDTAMTSVDGGLRITPDLVVPPKVCRNEKFWIFNHSAIRNPDTVKFLYSWNGGAMLDLNIIDSTKKALLDSPETVGFWSFEANSHGCITKGSNRPVTRILGPKLDGKVKALCNSDSLYGTNMSSVYTKTFWRYKNEKQESVIDPVLKLNRLMSNTQDLWLFAFNDTNNCSDSIDFKVKSDPIPAKFTLDYNCASRWLNALNQYPGLSDTMFTWTLTNQTSKSVKTIKSRNLSLALTEAGNYRIELQVQNPAYGCTPGASATVLVPSLPSGIPKASIDRNSCYPVRVTMEDASYKHWISANWKIGTQSLRDSVKTIQFDYTGAANQFPVYLQRTDSSGCLVSDTFIFDVHGMKAQIASSQSGNLCNTSIVNLNANLINPGAGPYTYEWDFGYRKGNAAKDTAHIKGYRSFPVSLTIKDDKGCASTTNTVISARNGSPIARFTVSDTSAACPPLDVFFTDISDTSQYPITKRFWDFGDNTYSNKEQPGKLYIYPGKYSVTMVVTNSVGCSDTSKIPNLVVVNGPMGTYTFDKKEGCTPLELNLTTSLSGKIRQLEFDMGDGAVLDLNENDHTYSRPGVYIPRLIIEDSNGCRFSPDPKDTIHVYPNPVASFDDLKACDNLEYFIPQRAAITGDSLAGIQWKVDGKYAGNKDSLLLTFDAAKRRRVELLVRSIHGCTDKFTREIRAYGIAPGLKSNKSEYCLGEKAFVVHNSKSDTTLVVRNLWLDGVLVPKGDSLPVTATRRGKIPALLVLEDAIGCRDTSYTPVFIKVGDTLPTVPLKMYRSSVLDDFTTETRFTESAEPDFKQYKLYVWMGSQWQLKATSDNVKDTNLWITGLNTLQNSYCHRISQLNFCGMETDSVAVLPHCTVEVKAYGDTNKSMVNWSPYSGWGGVEKYRIWRKKKDEQYYELIDSVPGNVNKYVDPSVFCYEVYDYHIEAIEKQGNKQNSWSDTARSAPFHLMSVPAPELWRTTVNDNRYTHTEWITRIAPKYGVKFYTLYKNSGSGWEVWKDSVSPNARSMDDYFTEVQNRNYSYTVQVTDKCDTKSPQSNVGRSILLKVRAEGVDGRPMVRWTPYIYWNEGVDEYRVERSIGGREFEEIGRVEGETHNFEDVTLPPYCEKDFVYRVTALRSQPANFPDSSHYVRSVSNYDQFAPPIRFFVPNAFTPNKNHLNEGFKPEGVYYYNYEMKIYNRYGQKLYDENYCQNSWDGNYNGEAAPDGVYVYYITATDLKGQPFVFTGTFHLLR